MTIDVLAGIVASDVRATPEPAYPIAKPEATRGSLSFSRHSCLQATTSGSSGQREAARTATTQKS
jgi:hypothetical protein